MRLLETTGLHQPGFPSWLQTPARQQRPGFFAGDLRRSEKIIPMAPPVAKRLMSPEPVTLSDLASIATPLKPPLDQTKES